MRRSHWTPLLYLSLLFGVQFRDSWASYVVLPNQLPRQQGPITNDIKLPLLSNSPVVALSHRFPVAISKGVDTGLHALSQAVLTKWPKAMCLPMVFEAMVSSGVTCRTMQNIQMHQISLNCRTLDTVFGSALIRSQGIPTPTLPGWNSLKNHMQDTMPYTHPFHASAGLLAAVALCILAAQLRLLRLDAVWRGMVQAVEWLAVQFEVAGSRGGKHAGGDSTVHEWSTTTATSAQIQEGQQTYSLVGEAGGVVGALVAAGDAATARRASPIDGGHRAASPLHVEVSPPGPLHSLADSPVQRSAQHRAGSHAHMGREPGHRPQTSTTSKHYHQQQQQQQPEQLLQWHQIVDGAQGQVSTCFPGPSSVPLPGHWAESRPSATRLPLAYSLLCVVLVLSPAGLVQVEGMEAGWARPWTAGAAATQGSRDRAVQVLSRPSASHVLALAGGRGLSGLHGVKASPKGSDGPTHSLSSIARNGGSRDENSSSTGSASSSRLNKGSRGGGGNRNSSSTNGTSTRSTPRALVLPSAGRPGHQGAVARTVEVRRLPEEAQPQPSSGLLHFHHQLDRLDSQAQRCTSNAAAATLENETMVLSRNNGTAMASHGSVESQGGKAAASWLGPLSSLWQRPADEQGPEALEPPGFIGVYAGWLAQGNLGDDLVADVFLDLLTAALLEATTHDTTITLDREDAQLMEQGWRGCTMAGDAECDYAVLGGGSTVSSDYIVRIASVLKAGKQVLLFGSGYQSGYLPRNISKQLLWRLLCSSQGHMSGGVRGPHTIDYLQTFGGCNSSITMIRDSGFLADPLYRGGRTHLRPELRSHIKAGRKIVVVTLQGAFMPLLDRTVRGLLEGGGFAIVLQAVDKSSAALHTSYQAVINGELPPGAQPILVHEEYEEWGAILDLYHHASVSLSARLHSGVVSASTLLPTLFVANNTKYQDFTASFGTTARHKSVSVTPGGIERNVTISPPPAVAADEDLVERIKEAIAHADKSHSRMAQLQQDTLRRYRAVMADFLRQLEQQEPLKVRATLCCKHIHVSRSTPADKRVLVRVQCL